MTKTMTWRGGRNEHPDNTPAHGPSDHELRLTLKKLFGKKRVRAVAGLGLAAAVVLGVTGVGQTTPRGRVQISETATTQTRSIPTTAQPSVTTASHATTAPSTSTALKDSVGAIPTTEPWDLACAALWMESGDAIYIRLQADPDESVSGFIERSVGGHSTIENVAGWLGNAQVHIVITAPDGSERIARWWFDPDGIQLQDDTFVPFTGCEGD
jgi:hypothetical protein